LGRVGRIGCSSFVFGYSWFHVAKNMMIDEDASAVCLVLLSGVLAIKQLASLVVLVLFSFMG